MEQLETERVVAELLNGVSTHDDRRAQLVEAAHEIELGFYFVAIAIEQFTFGRRKRSFAFLQPFQLPVTGLDGRAHEGATGHDLLGDAVVEDPRPVRLEKVEVLDLVDAGIDGAVDRLGGQAVGGRLLPNLMRFLDRGGQLRDAVTRQTTNRLIHRRSP